MTVDEIRKSAAEIEDEVNRLYVKMLEYDRRRLLGRQRALIAAVVFAAALGLAAAVVRAVTR